MNIEKFCEFNYIRNEFKPLTPYGRVYKENLKLIRDVKELEKRYDAIEIVEGIKKDKPFVYDKIKYHLKSIPYITSQSEISDITDLFIYKKFINNYYEIYKLLDKKLRTFFGFRYDLRKLYDLLNVDNSSDYFYLSDNYDRRLLTIRKEIYELVKKIEDEKRLFIEKIFKETGFDFTTTNFLVVNADDVREKINDYFNIEIYDSSKIILKPKYPDRIIEMLGEKQKLVLNEKEIEREIVKRLASQIVKEKSRIIEMTLALTFLDVAIASFELSMRFELKRPLPGKNFIEMKNGVFIPLKEKLSSMNIDYTPLTFSFKKRINIISGSNMGGKSVVLKTIALSQLMAQYGFFVPCDRLRTPVFDELYFINSDETEAGLSSFAFEIYNFVKIYNEIGNKKVLIISDEFARTTNTYEAVSLINSILYDFSKRDNIFFFLSTHFDRIMKFDNIEFLRMKGFNREKYNKYFSGKENSDVEDKIKTINKFMDYEIIKQDVNSIALSDALEISRIMGVSESIYKNAFMFLEETYGSKKR